ncbi:MAG TPA: hemin uptake protein HemP [Ramlibacter sp.]|uniref:hemin uptake protein HemP n=1 Tax=Ramlibacter sp. TaxID=1917967 RepID=UPI002ED36985
MNSTSVNGGGQRHEPLAPADRRAEERPAPLHSGALLQGRRLVEIEHNGEVYRLQATRLGKLILTK